MGVAGRARIGWARHGEDCISWLARQGRDRQGVAGLGWWGMAWMGGFVPARQAGRGMDRCGCQGVAGKERIGLSGLGWRGRHLMAGWDWIDWRDVSRSGEDGMEGLGADGRGADRRGWRGLTSKDGRDRAWSGVAGKEGFVLFRRG